MYNFYKIMESRRSIRVLANEEIITNERLEEIIANAVKFTPTAFNAQEQRVVLLLEDRHSWFWNLLKEKLKTRLPAESFSATEGKLNGLMGGVGTVLIYQDIAVINGLQEKFPTYKDNFPLWAQQSSGMLKYTIWTSLDAEGYGASLQHYTELIEESVSDKLGINKEWKMVGQIPFGKRLQAPDTNKTFEPIVDRMLVFK